MRFYTASCHVFVKLNFADILLSSFFTARTCRVVFDGKGDAQAVLKHKP